MGERFPRYRSRRDPSGDVAGQPPLYVVQTPRGEHRIHAKDHVEAIEVAREMCERDLEMDRDLAGDEGDA